MQLACNHLTDVVEVVDGIALTAAGFGDTINGNEVDMADAMGALFIVRFGTIAATAVTTYHIEESDDNSTYSDVTGATMSIAVADDDVTALIDVRRPAFTKRYLRCAVVRATANSEIDCGVAIKYGMNAGPPTQGAAGDTTAPAAGTVTVP